MRLPSPQPRLTPLRPPAKVSCPGIEINELLLRADQALSNFRLAHHSYLISANQFRWDEADKAQGEMIAYVEAYADLYKQACRKASGL